MLVYVCLYIKYNNNCPTVSKLKVYFFKADSQRDHVMLLVIVKKIKSDRKN